MIVRIYNIKNISSEKNIGNFVEKISIPKNEIVDSDLTTIKVFTEYNEQLKIFVEDNTDTGFVNIFFKYNDIVINDNTKIYVIYGDGIESNIQDLTIFEYYEHFDNTTTFFEAVEVYSQDAIIENSLFDNTANDNDLIYVVKPDNVGKINLFFYPQIRIKVYVSDIDKTNATLTDDFKIVSNYNTLTTITFTEYNKQHYIDMYVHDGKRYNVLNDLIEYEKCDYDENIVADLVFSSKKQVKYDYIFLFQGAPTKITLLEIKNINSLSELNLKNRPYKIAEDSIYFVKSDSFGLTHFNHDDKNQNEYIIDSSGKFIFLKDLLNKLENADFTSYTQAYIYKVKNSFNLFYVRIPELDNTAFSKISLKILNEDITFFDGTKEKILNVYNGISEHFNLIGNLDINMIRLFYTIL